jgi:lipopolysaccharide heptosyltransferase II
VQKFLVIQTAFIGDVVLATALLEKLHAFFPDAQIDFLVRKGNEALLAGHPWLHSVLVWDKKQNKIRNLWTMGRRIRRERYDKVINVQRFAATGLLTIFAGAKETIGFDKNPFSLFFKRRVPHVIGVPVKGGVEATTAATANLHEIDRNQALISAFTDEQPARPRLYPTAEDVEKVRGYKAAPFITISPASVWFTKQYPGNKWADFIGQVPGDYKIFLLGAPSDRPLTQSIVARAGVANIVDLSGDLSFLQSAALMRDAVMNYVNDSAPMHFASAVNAPVTAVYCSTIPGFGFGPLSDERYIVEIAEPLDCRPCGLHGYKACPLKHFNCARKIHDQQLLENLVNSHRAAPDSQEAK